MTVASHTAVDRIDQIDESAVRLAAFADGALQAVDVGGAPNAFHPQAPHQAQRPDGPKRSGQPFG
ncbi:MAG: hypothetical protein R2748_12580 [Bryobacterales bacterium]